MAIRRTLLTLVGVVLLLGATACGGGGDDDEQGSASASDVAEDSGSDAEAGSDGVLPTAEDEAAGEDGSGEPTAGGEAGTAGGQGGQTGGSGEPGSVATELGVDRTFTGEGSEELCDEMADIQGSATPDLGNTALADQMAAITPPPEIATEWELMHTVLKTIASDSSGAALQDMTQEEADEWATANAVVAAYLGDVCGLR
jgi:hypothetical protein